MTWLVDGEIVHRDGPGSDQPIRPGQLSLISSEHGISHSESSPPEHPPGTHGLRLRVALPEEGRSGEPRFEHHAERPVLHDGDATITVLAGPGDALRSTQWSAPGHHSRPSAGSQSGVGLSAVTAAGNTSRTSP